MGGTNSTAMPDGDTNASGDSGVPGESFTATPRPAPQSNTFLNGLSSGGLKHSAPVGLDAANRPDDVFRVESALSGADSPNNSAFPSSLAKPAPRTPWRPWGCCPTAAMGRC